MADKHPCDVQVHLACGDVCVYSACLDYSNKECCCTIQVY